MEKEVRGINYFSLGLYAFAGLGIEAIYAFLLEPFIYGSTMKNWNTSQNIIHWIITCITWGIVTFVIINYSKREYEFDIFEKKEKMKAWQWIGVIVCIILSLYISYQDWNGFKIIKEFQNLGVLQFIFQYLYYLFETILFMLILVYGQKSFEIWFRKENIPYGGIILALTWGLAHIFTKGDVRVGLLSGLLASAFGVVYLLVNRDIKKTFLILFIMFVS
ncbi:MAG: hypothetical protein WCY46_06505 [Tissierellaceae bacterium]